MSSPPPDGAGDGADEPTRWRRLRPMSRHVPHLYLPGPWESAELALSDGHRHHLSKVLRLVAGAPCSYTDGAGTIGTGTVADGRLVRGEERLVEHPRPEVSVAVAPPRSRDRQRYVVEKLAELGIDRLLWLDTRHGEGKAPPAGKAAAWAAGALEQSRGAWVMACEGPVSLQKLPETPTLWVAERESPPPRNVVDSGILVIGPESGFVEGEVPDRATRIGLGSRVLRVESAAVVGATILLDRAGRLHG
ncbi:MAG: 16S rRNA (uracil(1498)-N(3))-methyltransferase [Acidimicrobiia bacterium]|nr:16S rRNA (uracil(1498)-N(3))-methyltransferase [Acidimicrobiia bacterium]